MRFLLALLVFVGASVAAQARELTVATWNLGWHMDRATVPGWVEKCDLRYLEDPVTELWSPGTGPESKRGWEIDAFKIVGWDASVHPVCNVYRNSSNRVVAATAAAYDNRIGQLQRFIAANLPADVIVVQEVSSEEAVAEVLPKPGEFELCGFEGFKVQRIVIAWRRSIGTQISCKHEPSLSLPGNEPASQPRPGLALTLEVDGKRVAFLGVHLKSGCVSPFEGDQLLVWTGDAYRNCSILRQQVVPLEAWVESVSATADHVVLLGDLSRNFWHEAQDAAQVRADGTSPILPLPDGVAVNSLLEEVADGHPMDTPLTLLPEHCGVNAITAELYRQGDTRLLTEAERDLIGSAEYLGCRNAVGLDHILLDPGIHPIMAHSTSR